MRDLRYRSDQPSVPEWDAEVIYEDSWITINLNKNHGISNEKIRFNIINNQVKEYEVYDVDSLGSEKLRTRFICHYSDFSKNPHSIVYEDGLTVRFLYDKYNNPYKGLSLTFTTSYISTYGHYIQVPTDNNITGVIVYGDTIFYSYTYTGNYPIEVYYKFLTLNDLVFTYEYY